MSRPAISCIVQEDCHVGVVRNCDASHLEDRIGHQERVTHGRCLKYHLHFVHVLQIPRHLKYPMNVGGYVNMSVNGSV